MGWSKDGVATQDQFNPASWEDNKSRSTWVENVTKADKARHTVFVRKGLMKKYPHLSLEDVEYYLQRELSRRG
jgi:hypothetical protein